MVSIRTVTRLYGLVAVVSLLTVLGFSAVGIVTSRREARTEAEAFGFDGRRYVLDAAPPGSVLPVAVGSWRSLAEAASSFPAHRRVEGLHEVETPSLLVIRDGDSFRGVVALHVDRTFTKALDPVAGLVLYRNRALAELFTGVTVPWPAGETR